MSKYSEKKARQAQIAYAQMYGNEKTIEEVSSCVEVESLLAKAINCLDEAMKVKKMATHSDGQKRKLLESAKGRIVSARNKLAGALSDVRKGAVL